jgi:hypothetical protein
LINYQAISSILAHIYLHTNPNETASHFLAIAAYHTTPIWFEDVVFKVLFSIHPRTKRQNVPENNNFFRSLS